MIVLFFKAQIAHEPGMALIPIRDRIGRESARWRKMATPKRSRGRDTATIDMFDPQPSLDLVDPAAAHREQKMVLFPAPKAGGPGGEAEAAKPAQPESKSFDSAAWHAERDDRIAAARARGAKMLDKVEPYVETMRGLRISYLHGDEKGVITTVSSFGGSDYTIHVKWETGTYAGEDSTLMPSDRKDYEIIGSGYQVSFKRKKGTEGAWVIKPPLKPTKAPEPTPQPTLPDPVRRALDALLQPLVEGAEGLARARKTQARDGGRYAAEYAEPRMAEWDARKRKLAERVATVPEGPNRAAVQAYVDAKMPDLVLTDAERDWLSSGPNPLEDQRKALVRAEYNSYSPNHFPGSAGWMKNKRAADALAAFDAAHPEIAAAVDAQRKAADKARYDALSDFVKLGS